tara:strand:- start:7480 stop:7641 length:162 start_codon:yes stop_codon:yes gene_type:complete
MNLNDKEKKLISNVIHDHIWRQYNFYRGSDKEYLFNLIEKDALKLKNKLLKGV